MRIGLDLRWLEQAYRYSPIGAVPGVGTYSRGLWLGLARAFPEVELVALVSRNPALPESLRKLIQTAPRHSVQRLGLDGLIPAWSGRGRIRLALRLLENELGIATPIKALGLDVLHVLDHTSPPRRPGCPTVATLYDLIVWNATCQAKDIFGRLDRWHLSKLIERAQVLVPVSNASRDELKAHFPGRCGPLPVIPPGIDLEAFRQQNSALAVDALRGRFSFGGDYFLHVGVLVERKNPQGLIEAFGRVVQAGHREVSLLCVGPYHIHPAAREKVLQLAREQGIEAQVRLVGEVSGEELAGLYRHSLGLVFPSFAEGFGIPALECLASGTPCVVSGTTSLPEVVGEYGILVNPHRPEEIADGMLRLLADQPYRAMIAVEGPEWAQQFSLEAMAKGYMEVYRRLA